MISFIVIGRNIEFTAERCIESVFRFVKENKISRYEVIYVDSESTDNTLALVGKYPVMAYRLEGDVNAAIGRNIGAEHATGDILFFIDGDMEILPGFFRVGFESEKKLNYPFITGDFTDIVYDEQNRQVEIKDKNKETEARYMPVVGGLFIIHREEWEKAGGMDNRLIRHQDFDFGLTMAKSGLPNYRYPDLLAYHHTVSYYSSKRFREFVFDTKLLSYGILIRKHLFNKHFYKRFIRSRKSLLIFLLSILALIFSWEAGVILIAVYVIFQLLKLFKKRNEQASKFYVFSFNLLFDIYTLIAFLFYYPKKKQYKVFALR